MALIVTLVIPEVVSLPSAPSVTSHGNETAPLTTGIGINTSGGSITTMVLNVTTQNLRWKAYVGNVTGSLVLDDAGSYTIYDWDMISILGEIYATRSPSSISWPDINCSTAVNITNEEIYLYHTSNPNDNISTTFAVKSHAAFYTGNVKIDADNCFSLHTYVNDTNQDAAFEEFLLHDGNNMIYTTIIEEDIPGYAPNETFDFQMILPENGLANWTSSTAYYFYVELT